MPGTMTFNPSSLAINIVQFTVLGLMCACLQISKNEWCKWFRQSCTIIQLSYCIHVVNELHLLSKQANGQRLQNSQKGCEDTTERRQATVPGGICAGSITGSCSSVWRTLGEQGTCWEHATLSLALCRNFHHINLSTLWHQGSHILRKWRLLPSFQKPYHHLFWYLHSRYKPVDPSPPPRKGWLKHKNLPELLRSMIQFY